MNLTHTTFFSKSNKSCELLKGGRVNSSDSNQITIDQYWRHYWMRKYSDVLRTTELTFKEQQYNWALVNRFLEQHPGNPRHISLEAISSGISSAPHALKSALLLFYSHVAVSQPHVDRVRSFDKKIKPSTDLLNKLIESMRIRNYSIRTIQNYTSLVKAYLHWLGKEPQQEDFNDIKRYILYLKDKKNSSARTINLQLAAVQFFYREVIKVSSFEENIPRMKTPRSLPKVYSEKQIENLISSEKNLKHKLVLVLAYGCGLRLEELRTLRERDFDREKNLLRLKLGKGRKDRIIMLDSKIIELLDVY